VADAAEQPLLEETVAGLGDVRRAAPLGADLDHTFVAAGAATIAWPSTTSTLMGFCTQTSAPASRAAMVGRACQWSGGSTMTMSRSFSLSIWR